MEPLVVCFCVSEELLRGIRAVDCLVLERQAMLMGIFTWTRYSMLHPSESSESSGVSLDNGSLKAPSSPVGGIMMRSTLLYHPAVVAGSFPSRRTETV